MQVSALSAIKRTCAQPSICEVEASQEKDKFAPHKTLKSSTRFKPNTNYISINFVIVLWYVIGD